MLITANDKIQDVCQPCSLTPYEYSALRVSVGVGVSVLPTTLARNSNEGDGNCRCDDGITGN